LPFRQINRSFEARCLKSSSPWLKCMQRCEKKPTQPIALKELRYA
jgi:hypothetical protein